VVVRQFWLALRSGIGFGYERQIGISAKAKSGNLKGKLGDWIFDHFFQPLYDAEYNRMMAEHHRRMLQIWLDKQRGIYTHGYGGGGGGGAAGGPPSGGK